MAIAMEKGKGGKKDHHENKRKRNLENKHVNNGPSHSKKAKKNKNNEGGEKTSKKKQSSTLMWFLFTQIKVIAVVIAFLYLVDYEKFTKAKLATNAYLNKTLSLLPPEIVTKGKEAFEFIRPPAEAIVNQLSTVVSKTSTFLDTNPVVRDHWVIVRESISICSKLFVEYLRTLYHQICWCCNKFWP